MLVSSVVYLTCFNRILNLFQSYTEPCFSRILNYCYYTMSDNQWFVKLLFGVNK